jgi:hypothetical protein
MEWRVEEGEEGGGGCRREGGRMKKGWREGVERTVVKSEGRGGEREKEREKQEESKVGHNVRAATRLWRVTRVASGRFEGPTRVTWVTRRKNSPASDSRVLA